MKQWTRPAEKPLPVQSTSIRSSSRVRRRTPTTGDPGLLATILESFTPARTDAILVHSKRKDSAEIMAFMRHWDNRVPVVIVPTKYPSEPLENFVRAGVSNFIFANQSLRTVVTALQRNLPRQRLARLPIQLHLRQRRRSNAK